MNDDLRRIATGLSIWQTSVLVNTGDPVLVINVPPIEQGKFWYVERATVQMQFDSTGANPPSTGDVMGLYLCPPNQPADTESANLVGPAAGSRAILARPIIIFEADLAGLVAAQTTEANLVDLAGVARTTMVSMRALRPILVPSTWTLRAIANLTGDVGGIAATTKMTITLMYAQLDNC
jgi:hypothetical protein